MPWLDYSFARLYEFIIITMNKLILNRVAIWQPKNLDVFMGRPHPAGRIYFENGIAKLSDKMMFRYGKNYQVGKGKSAIKFCLFLHTFSDAEKKIESFLDDVAKTIDAGYAQKVLMTSSMAGFEYTDDYYGGEK